MRCSQLEEGGRNGHRSWREWAAVAWCAAVVGMMMLVSEAGGASGDVVGSDVERFTVYHSPQTPGYTCWVGCWLMPDGTVMVSFHQITGPLSGRPMARKDIRERLNWPRPGGSPGYDMTGTIQEIIHLASSDGGRSWEKVSSEPFHTPMNGLTCEAETALPDGTIVRGVLGSWLVFYDVPQTGFLQFSKDGAKSWGPPQVLESKINPRRLRVLRDGRLVLLSQQDVFVSADGGRTWSEPILAWPADDGTKLSSESDFAELPDGRLLFVHRADRPPSRWQSVLEGDEGSFRLVSHGPAPFPHSGHPEMLAAREGVVLHLATSGIHWTRDGGRSWHDLGIGGTGYYPRSVQLPDGRIFCVYHRGGDNPYDGSVDQEIQGMMFRLEAEREGRGSIQESGARSQEPD